MQRNFAGQTYIITGAASGIGAATARLLHSYGTRLVLWDNNPAIDQIAQRLNGCGRVLDVTQSEQVRFAAEQAASQFGAINGVIHSAGILHTGLFEDISIEEHYRMVEVNLFGTILIAYNTIPYLKATEGSLILLGSTAAFYGAPEFAPYGATKAGVLNLAQALRIELASANVHVGVASPLFVGSTMLNQHNRTARLFQRYGVTHTPDQVAEAIARGIIRRQFLIWPGWQPHAAFWLSRYLHFAEHVFMRLMSR